MRPAERHVAAAPESAPLELSLVVPVYNEADNILPTLRRIEAAGLTRFELVIVYDHDEDTTLPVLSRHAAEFPFARAVKNRRGRGALAAIRTGFDDARGEGVLVVMADLADDLSAIGPMLAAFRLGADVVCGSRYMRGGAQRGGPRLKGLLSRGAGLSLHLLTGLPTHDVTNSFKLYRRRFLETIDIESTGGFEIGMEITVKAFERGGRIVEVPSIWTDRAHGESRFDLRRWLPRYIGWYLYALRARVRSVAGKER
ncbi:MAG: glycosyltransferase [Deltaproteobacteria bacterium]